MHLLHKVALIFLVVVIIIIIILPANSETINNETTLETGSLERHGLQLEDWQHDFLGDIFNKSHFNNKLLGLSALREALQKLSHDNEQFQAGDDYCNLTTAFHLPNCMMLNLTISSTLYVGGINDAINDVDNNYYFNRVMLFNVSNDGAAMSICFPLSPQLLNCELRKYHPQCFFIGYRSLHFHMSDIKLRLGDFYVDQNGYAYTCKDLISSTVTVPRCNYLRLPPDQYAFVNDTNIYINDTKTIIIRPFYSIDSQHMLNVCYPLSTRFLKCPPKSLTILGQTDVKMRYTQLFHKDYKYVLGPSEWYTDFNSGNIIVCLTETYIRENNVIEWIYFAIEIGSIVCLVITIYRQLVGSTISTNYTKCLLLHSTCILAFHVILAVQDWMDLYKRPKPCFAFLILRKLSNVAAYMWLVIAIFDLWLTFSNLQTSRIHRPYLQKRFRFIAYSLTVWVTAAILCSLIVILKITEKSDTFEMTNVLFGHRCAFQSYKRSLISQYGNAIILSTINAIFLTLTAMTFQREYKRTKSVGRHDKRQL